MKVLLIVGRQRSRVLVSGITAVGLLWAGEEIEKTLHSCLCSECLCLAKDR